MSRLKPILFFVLVAVIALFLVLRRPASKVVNVGDPAPEFEINGEFIVKDETGKFLKLADLRGNVVFLNFWYTTCEPCRREMPDMELVTRVFKDRKFKMVPISVDTNFEDIKRFYGEHQLTMPMYLDPGKRIASRYNVYKFPETYIIDGNGIVLKHYIGERAWSKANYLSSLEEYLKRRRRPKAPRNEVGFRGGAKGTRS
jgi:peroxiredoxin